MKCHICGSTTSIARSKESKDGAHHRRRRLCTSDARHVFDTVEQPEVTLRGALVRRTGDGQLTKAGFDERRLLRDVSEGVLKRLTLEEVRLVVDRAMDDLELSFPNILNDMTPSEKRQRPGFKFWIWDYAIREAVEGQLRRYGSRMPHVLYALSTLGRSDRPGRDGFRDASAVLHWMHQPENYPDLKERDVPATTSMPVHFWWPPSPRTPTPSTVVRRDKVTRRSFGAGQFQKSIELAMLGRPLAEERSKKVAAWVLWGLAGQDAVLTAQLAVGVMQCLRQFDDIAYLRWAAIAKNMQSVRDFHREALSLVEHPSVRLEFNVQALSTGLAPTVRA